MARTLFPRPFHVKKLPLTRERYDLVIPAEHLSAGSMQAILNIIRSEAFKQQVRKMGGYDTSDTGREAVQAGAKDS